MPQANVQHGAKQGTVASAPKTALADPAAATSLLPQQGSPAAGLLQTPDATRRTRFSLDPAEDNEGEAPGALFDTIIRTSPWGSPSKDAKTMGSQAGHCIENEYHLRTRPGTHIHVRGHTCATALPAQQWRWHLLSDSLAKLRKLTLQLVKQHAVLPPA
jgi:hypothetical protein